MTKRELNAAFRAGVLAILIALAGCGGEADEEGPGLPSDTVAPLPAAGPYPVACSNVAQDFARVPAGEEAKAYWEGSPSSDATPRYVSSLLVDPTSTLSVVVAAPDDRSLYGSFAGTQVASVLIVCYPTVASNPRPDYALPSGESVPRMQVGAEAPLFADAGTRYPVLAFSHGLFGSPLSGDYLGAIKVFASYGYVVVAPFHGDPRFVALAFDDFSDALALLGSLSDFLALQALRPLAISAALDLILTHPQWRDHVDANQIGGFGASMGGETMLLLAGAGLTSASDLAPRQVTFDARMKGAVGYVPYFGQLALPAFGRDQSGLDNVMLPFLAISGTADITAPIVVTEQGMNRLAGRRELVSLNGVVHRFDVPSANDIFTWSLIFLDAEVRGNAAARSTLSNLRRVAGGGDDRVVIPYNGPDS